MDVTEAEATTEDREDPNAPAGRAAVVAILLGAIAPLTVPRGYTAADYDALADHLAHLTRAELEGLAEWLTAVAAAGSKAWTARPGYRLAAPLIRVAGYAVRHPPPDRSAYAASVMRSALGQKAMTEGWHVELLRCCLRYGPPPQKYAIEALRIEAQNNARLIERIRERSAAGRAWAEDSPWLGQWTDDLRLAEALVAEGETARGAGTGAAA